MNDLIVFLTARLNELEKEVIGDRIETSEQQYIVADIAAKRSLIRWVMNWPMRPAPPSSVDGILERLALPFDWHRDYREEWKP